MNYLVELLKVDLTKHYSDLNGDHYHPMSDMATATNWHPCMLIFPVKV